MQWFKFLINFILERTLEITIEKNIEVLEIIINKIGAKNIVWALTGSTS